MLVDGAKIYGACPNRMDPPTSHILTNNVESVEVNEGPYDVENFGTLSGSVNITTREPEPGLHGDFSINVGSWNYWKAAPTLTGGSDRVRALASISHEESDQYEDGDGNTFAEQIKKFYPDSTARYKPEYEDRKAYEKQVPIPTIVTADSTDRDRCTHRCSHWSGLFTLTGHDPSTRRRACASTRHAARGGAHRGVADREWHRPGWPRRCSRASARWVAGWR